VLCIRDRFVKTPLKLPEVEVVFPEPNLDAYSASNASSEAYSPEEVEYATPIGTWANTAQEGDIFPHTVKGDNVGGFFRLSPTGELTGIMRMTSAGAYFYPEQV
jgi:hypothetical protein